MKHLNILLCGNSGAGKSTLINAILELKDEEQAKADFGKAITIETKYYSSTSVPFLRCADSRGIEIRQSGVQSYGISEVMKEMNKFISDQLDTGNPDNYIHCIWYCILTLDSRFTDEIDECLKELEKSYKLNGVPIIIVGTKSMSKEFNDQFAKYLKDGNYKYDFIPVLAKKVDNHEPFGLEELKLKSIELAMKGVESSCYQGIINNITKTSNLKIENQEKIIKENIQNKKEEIFKTIELNPKFETVKTEINNIFIYILNQYVSISLSDKNIIENENDQKKISEESKNNINDLIKKFDDYCKGLYDESFKNFLNSKVNEFLEEMTEIKDEFLQSTEVHIKTKTREQMKSGIEKKVKKELEIKSDIYYLKNIFNEFVNLLTESFKKLFICFYNKLIERKENEEETKNLIISKITKQFEDLEKEIKEKYNQEKENQKKENQNSNPAANKLLNRFKKQKNK